MVRNHTKLRAFHLADELVLKVYEVTRGFPKDETFGLASQLRRTSVSAATNIVEGCARRGEKDYLRFLDIAFGSAREVAYLLSVATRLGYLPDGSPASLADEVCRTLNGLIQSIECLRD